MHPGLRSVVKPAVEIMAALPSVVLGFIAGLWLAPMVERIVPGLLLMPLVIPLLAVLASAAWTKGPGPRPSAGSRTAPRSSLLVPLVVGGGALSIWLGGLVEASLLSRRLPAGPPEGRSGSPTTSGTPSSSASRWASP